MKKRMLIYGVLLTIICMTLTGCTESSREKKEITNKAREYLKEKYNINRFQYGIRINAFYGDKKRCMWECGDNKMEIKYNKNSYLVFYDKESGTFRDDIQYEEILEDLKKDFSNKYEKPINIEAKFDKYNTLYYDGTNLKSMIKDLRVTAYIDNKQKYKEEKANTFLKEFYNKYGGEIAIVYFENNSDYNNYMDLRNESTALSTYFYGYAERYVDFFMIIKEGNIEKISSNKINLGNGLIAAWWNASDDIKLEPIEPFDLNEIPDYSPSTYQQNSNFYKLKSNQADLYLNGYQIMKVDDKETGDYIVLMKKYDKDGNVSYELVNATLDNRLFFTKYTSCSEIDFVIFKK